MKLFKLLTSALVAGLIFLFIKQNITAFTTRIPFGLDLFIREPVSWSHEVYGLMIMAGLVGFVVGFAALLRPYLNMRRDLAQAHPEVKDKDKELSSVPNHESPSEEARKDPPQE